MVGRRERKIVTVLFADLAGFTAQAEALDPEDVAALLDPYQSRLKVELERFGGSVEKFIGDAVMAVFGAPVAHEDDAERAVRAALAIRDWAEEEGIELRVGINTGEALVTLVARPDEGQTLAAGDVVNTAARLQTAAPLNAILVGEQTVRATDKTIEFAPEPPVAAKGKAEPVPAWRAVAARARPSVDRIHGATLVGRQRELELLAGALDRARQERAPQLVTIVGVPGIGKSRLVFELYGRIEREVELTSWRQGRCLPYGEGITFWALGEMVKAHAGIRDGDSQEEARRKLALAVDDPWVEGHLRPLVGLGGGTDGGGERREEAFTAWLRFFEQLADEHTLVLVFDDVHWADENLLDFVDHLVEWATDVPLLVVCTTRPELFGRRRDWGGGKANALTISLSPLSDVETVALVGGLLESAVLPAQAQSELLARAGGNPLYAEEFVRMLREHGTVDQLPGTVHGMIAARLDLLEPPLKALVQDASVVGSTFWLGALEALSGGERRDHEVGLHELERKEFVRRSRSSSVADEAEYAFRHVLVRDVAYNQIPRADRTEKHLAAAAWLESLSRPEDHSELLAYHYQQALELATAARLDTTAFAPRAYGALVVAGDRAFSLSAFDAAVRYWRGALDLQHADDQGRASLLLRLGRAFFFGGGPAEETLAEALEALRAVDDAEGAAQAECSLADLLWLAGDRASAFAHLDAALALVEPLPPSPAKAQAIAMASRFRMLGGDLGDAIRLGGQALAMAEALGLNETRAATLNNVGTARAGLNDPHGREDLAEAIRIAAASNSPFELCRAKGNLASQLWLAGDLAGGLHLWNEAAEDATRYGQFTFGRWFEAVVVEPVFLLGDWDAALARADVFLAGVEAGNPHYLSSQVYGTRALVHLGRDRSELARADSEQGIVYARRAADPQAVLPALARGAHVALELGDADRAAALVDEYLGMIAGSELGHAFSTVDVAAWTVTALGRGSDLVAALRESDLPWAQAGLAFAAGDPVRAADVVGALGARTEEAYCRLAASKTLFEAGRHAEALEQRDRALAFYRGVSATRFKRAAESLTALSA